MTVRKVMIIRHGEKPPKNKPPPPPYGVDLDGIQSLDQLIPRGWQRAGAIVSIFAPLDGRAPRPMIERPTAVFAAGISDQSSSLRMQSTVGPIVLALGNVPFTLLPAPGNEPAAAQQILDFGSDVSLVCWEHKHIKDLVADITGGTVQSPHWKGSRFDGIFALTFAAGRWAFAEVPQLLLAGDLPSSVSVPAAGFAADEDD